MKAKGYSLWLLPTGEVYEKLATLIKKLAEENNTPIFDPHVTLLGEIIQSKGDIVRKIEELISDQKQFPLTLSRIDYQDFYFRALFVKAEINESLLSLHNQAKMIFGMQNIPPYMPHLSLLYGNLSTATKEKITEMIGKDQTTQFTADRIYLFKTGGEVSTWYKIKEFRFSK